MKESYNKLKEKAGERGKDDTRRIYTNLPRKAKNQKRGRKHRLHSGQPLRLDAAFVHKLVPRA